MQTETVPNNHKPKEGRGFSSLEKWIIWAVFCLLVGLSSRLTVFPGLLLISWGVVRFRWYVGEKTAWRRRWPAVMVFLAGAALLLWPILNSI